MTSNELSRAKKQIRAEIKAKLDSLSIDRRKTADALFRQIANIPQLNRAKVVGIFVDFQKEVPVRYVIPRLFDAFSNIQRVGVPFCEGKLMRFYNLQKPSVDPIAGEPTFRDLVPLSYGILEPPREAQLIESNIISPKEIDLLFVPGIAFDLNGRRLGRGAGFYDRYLPQLRRDALIVGIAYDEQLVDKAPVDAFDYPVHALVTPQRVLYFS
ncbi:MAG: 5-formyltetrahydrofolate cyclo-ligase [Thermoguttaceae bacterium]